MSRGRPRGFDRDTALDQAMHVFWSMGYEPASIAVLTEAMGIRAASLYAAFGDKRRLFTETIERYQSLYADDLGRALAEAPTARDAVAALLHRVAADYADPSHPPGCLVISGAVNHGPAAADVEEGLRRIRRDSRDAVAARIRDDVDSGELPAGTDADALADFTAAVVRGMSRSAQDGASAADLAKVADLAMAAWPRP